MTRINVINPHILTDQHLLAEHRELTRIPNNILSGKLNIPKDIPKKYLLGTGHVKFFVNKLLWLCSRYSSIHTECIRRGFKVTYKWPSHNNRFFDMGLMGGYAVTKEDIDMNIERLVERFPSKARFKGNLITKEEYLVMVNRLKY